MALQLTDALAPLRADPLNSAVLLDVDGTLAPIVATPEDAHMPETTRRPLIEVARKYGVVACVSGRRAADARRIVSLGTITYLGSHGSELLGPGKTSAVLDREMSSWADRVGRFAAGAFTDEHRKLRIRIEDKQAIAAFHWRGAPDEEAAHDAVRELGRAAEAAGFHLHWGRKVLEVRPPLQIDKGSGIVKLLGSRDLSAAVYVGDDATDLDAFDGLDKLVERGRLATALKVGVRSDEGPSALAERADLMVDGTAGVRDLLRALTD